MPSTRTTAASQPEAIKMLMKDHRAVEKLYKQFEKLKDEDDVEKEAIISQACGALTAHAMLEEELFYPAIKDQIKESDLIDEAEVEHQSLKELIAKLESGELDAEKRDATFIVLCEYVMHHVQEEENEIFPQVAKAKELDLDTLGGAMAERKAQLEAEFAAGSAESVTAAAAPSPKKGASRKKAA